MYTLTLLAALLLAVPASSDELAVAALTDAARMDPPGFCRFCEEYADVRCEDWADAEAPRAPFTFSEVLSDAARFHARHIADAPCFQHESCCELRAREDGPPVCVAPPCSVCGATACPGTSPEVRYAMLGYAEFSGENLIAGVGTPPEAVCGWLASAGHRENILLPHREIGVGRADTAQCFGRYWAQGFGARRTSRGPVAAASAVRFGAQFEAASVRFAAAYDDDAGPPKRALAVVDGACAPLQLAFGAPERGLYWGGGTFTAGECVPYWFLFETASGGRAVWPPSGALVFGADCPDAQPERPPAQCEGPNACAPDGAHRGCYAGPAGTEGVGECRGGVQHCEFGGWGACRDGVVPRAEACNGLDDDCDRETDEGDPESGGSCDTGLKGACAAGHLECRGGGLACLGDRAPAAETCNGEDDDCDGAVDDGLGQIACGEGACRRLVPACEGGAPVPCVAGVPAASDACGDGIDQDCDGVPDDGCACAAGAEQPCYSSPFDTLSRGACAPGRQTCAAGGWGACAGETPPRPEACNGLDDDCDGATDEGLGRVRCGVGGCAVVMPACEQGAPAECRPLSPRPESCDGRDDNCDGVVDEGCFCREGTARPCYPGPSGTLGIGACREGLTPCRGGRWDGCEDAVVPGDERCGTGMDEDCDGETDEVGCTQGEALPPPREPPGCGCGTRVESGSESGAALGLLAFTFAWGARRRRSGKSRPPVRPGLHS